MKVKVIIYYPNCESSIFEDAYVEETDVSYIRFRTSAGNWVETSLPYLYEKAAK